MVQTFASSEEEGAAARSKNAANFSAEEAPTFDPDRTLIIRRQCSPDDVGVVNADTPPTAGQQQAKAEIVTATTTTFARIVMAEHLEWLKGIFL